MLLWGFSKTSRDEFINVIVAWKEHNKFLHERNESFYTLKVSERGPKERGNVFKVSILSKKNHPFFLSLKITGKLSMRFPAFYPLLTIELKSIKIRCMKSNQENASPIFLQFLKLRKKRGNFFDEIETSFFGAGHHTVYFQIVFPSWHHG